MKKYATTVALTAMLAAAPAHAQLATSLDDNFVVRSTNGNIVHSLGSGKCVRTTNWEAGYDICAPKEEMPIAEPVTIQQVMKTVLSTAEAIVFFDFDKADLTPQSQQQLDAVAAKLSSAADVESASIVGFADRMGSNSYNDKLSLKRAQIVKWYLAQRGYVTTQVVSLQAVGESQPSVKCETNLPRSQQIACLSPDRKVELKLQYKQQVSQPVAAQPVVPTAPAAQPAGY